MSKVLPLRDPLTDHWRSKPGLLLEFRDMQKTLNLQEGRSATSSILPLDQKFIGRLWKKNYAGFKLKKITASEMVFKN